MRVAIIALALAVPLAANAEEGVSDWLGRMHRSMSTLNYEGTLVYARGTRLEAMRVLHAREAGVTREKLTSLSGQPREVIRDGGSLTCIWPGRNPIVIGSRSSAKQGLPAVPVQAGMNTTDYDYHLGPEGRVAGQTCRYIRIQPVDDYRYGYQLCVGTQHGMLLKSIMFDEHGRRVEQMMFTDFHVREQIPAADFKSSVNGQAPRMTTPLSEKSDPGLKPDPGWQVGWMPEGFHPVSTVMRHMNGLSAPVQHIILSDGIASVSVYISKADGDKDDYEGGLERGALHAYATYVDGHEVTVVGETPAATVRRIAGSVRYNAQHD
ncbi:MAG: MucB/RseB C-terminal domain-containing protein [Gammaproteobacteria bacterium]|jgi:sigma-E factor negative regulatory protein RseB